MTRNVVERELARAFGWEVAVHEPYDDDEGHVWLGCRYDRTGNQGYGMGDYDLARLAAVLPGLPDWPEVVSHGDGEVSGGAAPQTWLAIEAAKVSN